MSDFQGLSGAEVDMGFQTWIDGITRFILGSSLILLVLGLLCVVASLFAAQVVRRRFWCREAERDVEVAFGAQGFWRRPGAVLSCTAFEAGAPISCHRRCVDAAYRTVCEPPALLATRYTGVEHAEDDGRRY